MTIKLFTLHQQTKLAEKREQPYRIGLQVQKTSFIDILVHYFPNGREVSNPGSREHDSPIKYSTELRGRKKDSAPGETDNNTGNGRRKIVHEQ